MSDCIISPLASGETYATVADLIALDDRPQATVTIPRWQAGGQPLRLLLRALSLEQQEAVHRAARKKDALTGQATTDRVIFTVETLRLACVQPQIDAVQAKLFAAKNATVLEAVVEFIWSVLSRLDHEQIAAIVRESADLDDDDAGDSPDGGDGSLA